MMRWTEGGAKACNAAAFVFAGSFPPLQGITYVAWPRGRSREERGRGMQFLPSCKTRAGRTFASFGASSTARNAIGHFGGKSDTAARRRKVALPWGVFPLRGWRFLPTTSQIKGKQLREIINRSVTKGMSRRHEIAQKPRKEREFIIGPFVRTLDYYVLLIRQKNVATQPFVIAADWLRIFSRPSFQVKHRLGVPPGSQQQLSPRGRMNDQVPNQTENSDIPAIYAVRLSDKVCGGDL